MVNLFYPVEWFAREVVLFLSGVFGFEMSSHVGESLLFIVNDLIKIFILLGLMVFIVSYLRTYVRPENIRKRLSGKKGVVYHFFASGVGVVSPFCSCSSIPIFIGFIEAGVPLGITFSYLITSPLINQAALILLFSMFGFKVMMAYLVVGVMVGVIGGMVIGKLKMEDQVQEYVYKIKFDKAKTNVSKDGVKSAVAVGEIKENQKERLVFAKREVKDIFVKVWIYVFIGVILGGIFHGFAPTEFITKYFGEGNFFAIPFIILLGIPLYINVLGTLPIAESLITKGLPIGTALAFMMAVSAISLPEIIILKKVLKDKLIYTFVGIVTLSIILSAYLFNWIL